MLVTEPKDQTGEKKREDEKTARAVGTAPVIKVIEIIGTSAESFDDAIATGITTAARSLRHITGADVKHLTVTVQDGKVARYKADLKVAFALEADDEDD